MKVQITFNDLQNICKASVNDHAGMELALEWAGHANNEIDRLNGRLRVMHDALEEITRLVSHRNPCCPTNPAKRIARNALEVT